ncbi:MAG: hypothetical protein EOO68_13010, partial [Moraxellaceae bacterium]
MKLIPIIALLGFASIANSDENGAATDKDGSVARIDGTLIDESILRTNAALKSYKNDYLARPENKAFA